MRKLLFAALAAVAALAVPACKGLATDTEITQGVAKIDAAREAAAAQAEAATDPATKAQAEALAAKHAKALAELAEAQAKIAASEKDSSAQAAAVETIGSLVPGVGTAIGLGSGALVAGFSLLGQMKWRRVARQIIDGFEAAQASSPDLAAAIDEAAPLIHSAMDVATIATVRGELSRRRTRSGQPQRSRPATPAAAKAKRKKQPTPTA